MDAQFSNTHPSTTTTVTPQSTQHSYYDWSFLPTFGSGLSGIAIGYGIGMLLGWC